MPSSTAIRQTVDHFFRHESGKMTAVLSRLLGLQNLETAQDIVQDTLLQAMHTWRYNTIPENPSAWLYRVARNKAIDYLRREKKFREISPQYAYRLQSEYSLSPTVSNLFLENEIEDSQLRMMFACCHPQIPDESRIALTLKTLCGLSVHEIAHAFLTHDDTIAKRIYRAREKIKSEQIELIEPEGLDLQERLDSVLKSLYLLFNEGYNSTNPDNLIREDLCEEAIRLGRLLSQHAITRVPRTFALLSLFCFQASRLRARLDDNGHIIILKYQDRSRWNAALMEKGFEYLELAAEPFEVSSYHLEAAIASLHASAQSFEQTDWKSIHHLYELLYRLQPGPVVAMNKAVASSYAIGKRHALHELQQISGLENHHIYFACLGELHLDVGETSLAKAHFEKALQLTSSHSEKIFLKDKISQCSR